MSGWPYIQWITNSSDHPWSPFSILGQQDLVTMDPDENILQTTTLCAFFTNVVEALLTAFLFLAQIKIYFSLLNVVADDFGAYIRHVKASNMSIKLIKRSHVCLSCAIISCTFVLDVNNCKISATRSKSVNFLRRH